MILVLKLRELALDLRGVLFEVEVILVVLDFVGLGLVHSRFISLLIESQCLIREEVLCKRKMN